MKSSATFVRRSKGVDGSESRSQVVLRRSQRLRGMSNPESGSNQFCSRRSARLCELAKSARTMSQSTQLAPGKPRKPHKPRKPSRCSPKPHELSVHWAGDCPIYFTGSYEDIDKIRRTTRKANAKYFRFAYKNVYDSISDGRLNIKERKHILACDRKICKDYDKSHGIMWVAVHGINSICAVFKNEAPDMKRILDLVGERLIMTYFGKYVLSEMEDLADSDMIGGGKPFAVVSITPGTDNVVEENCYEASGDMLDEEKAIEILKGSTDRGSPLTSEETIQTAISAFHHLFKKKLKPEEIWVTAFRDNGSYDFFRDLSTHEIKKHLDDIQQQSMPSSTR